MCNVYCFSVQNKKQEFADWDSSTNRISVICQKMWTVFKKLSWLKMSISPAWHQVFSQFRSSAKLTTQHCVCAKISKQQHSRGAKYLCMSATIYIFDRGDKRKGYSDPFFDVATGDHVYGLIYIMVSSNFSQPISRKFFKYQLCKCHNYSL